MRDGPEWKSNSSDAMHFQVCYRPPSARLILHDQLFKNKETPLIPQSHLTSAY